jgi:hypothetical protein
MTSLPSLWLAILLSAVAVFLVSSVVHMLLPHHRGDFRQVPGEAELMTVMGRNNVTPGAYMFPWAGSMQAMRDPAWIEKRTKGPSGILTIMPAGMPGMAKNLVQWFIYSLVISFFAAYIASRAVPAGGRGAEVFRYTTTAAFMAYGLGMTHESVWFSRPWSTTVKYWFDALLYAGATGLVYMWLWPHA